MSRRALLQLGCIVTLLTPSARAVTPEEAFARKIGPSAEPFPGPVFSRTGEDASVDVIEYACRDGLRVTLLPTLHFGEAAFYARLDEIAAKHEHVFFEGVKPAGFFGAPSDVDPRGALDPRRATDRRLNTLRRAVLAFRAHAGRNPKTLAEAYARTSIRGFDLAGRVLVDAWGTPLVYAVDPDGRIVIASRGPDRLDSDDDFGLELAPPHDERITPWPADPLAEQAHALGLTMQRDFAMTSLAKPGAHDVDVSEEMLGSDPHVRAMLPALELDALDRPRSVALLYGAMHAARLHQNLTGTRFGCVVHQRERLIVVKGTTARRKLIDELVSLKFPD